MPVVPVLQDEGWEVQVLKYHVVPGWVTSKYDGDRHFISAHELIRLYEVDPRECTRDPIKGLGLIRLTPRYHGDYKKWLQFLNPK